MFEKKFVIDYDLEELEDENVKLRAKIEEQQFTIKELKEENEKLRQENNFLKQIREAFQINVKNSRQKM